MIERRIFNHPIRKYTTGEFYPYKISMDEFEAVIVGSFKTFKANMEKLKDEALEDKYIEEWVEQYLAWLEIEEER